MRPDRKTGTRALSGAAMCAALLSAAPTCANIVYSVDQPIGVGSVVGTVTTDGTLGTLATGDFLSWNLVLNGNGASSTITNSDSGAAVLVTGADVFASATAITFDFSASDGGYLLFQDGLFSGTHYWCNASSAGTCLQGETVTPGSIFDSSAVNIAATDVQVIATASSGVPEPSTWAMMLIGFAGLGFAGYQRAHKVSPA